LLGLLFGLRAQRRIQFFVGTADADVERYLNLLTFLPLPTIESTMSKHILDPSKREAQHLLAREFIELVHGEAEARKAEAEHRSLFGKKQLPTAEEHDSEASGPVTGKLTARVDLLLPVSLVQRQTLSKIVWSIGLASSRSRAHDHILQGAIYIGQRSTENDELTFVPVKSFSSDRTTVPVTKQHMLIDGQLLVLRRGKKNIRVCKVVSDEEFAESGIVVPASEQQNESEKASKE